MKVNFTRRLVWVGLVIALLFGVGCFPGEMPEETYAGYEEVVAGSGSGGNARL